MDSPQSDATSAESKTQRLHIPLWVALAGMVVALIIFVLVMTNILEPLVGLVFPQEANVPTPNGAVLLEENDGGRTSTAEKYYGVDADGCEIAQFFQDEGATCRYTPLVCGTDEDGTLSQNIPERVDHIATCTRRVEGTVDGYTWEIFISAGFGGTYNTQYRVFLYEQR